jgi:chromosome partitioning protein
MRKLTVSLSKGGVGKTTTAVSLAHGLARAGVKVLLIDADAQGQASRALGLQPTAGLAHLLAGGSPEEATVLARDNLWLMAGGKELTGTKREIDKRSYGGERALSEALEAVDGKYDFALLDTAPGLDTLAINVLFYAEEILCPVSMEVLTLQGLADFQHTISGVQKHHKALRLRYVLPTFLDGRVRKSQEILEQLQVHYRQQLCRPIRYSVRLSEAPGFGQTVFEYSPRSTGAEDYQALTERILRDGR